MKNFNEWNILKQHIDLETKDFPFKEGDIWWCSIGQNIGSEVYGKGEYFRRPVLILKKLTADSCIAIPTTTKEHTGTWYWQLQTNTNNEEMWLLLHQIKHISRKRLYVWEARVSQDEFIKIKKALASLLGLSWSPDITLDH